MIDYTVSRVKGAHCNNLTGADREKDRERERERERERKREKEREIMCWLLTRYDKRADQIYVSFVF
jgi:hypothetical protein